MAGVRVAEWRQIPGSAQVLAYNGSVATAPYKIGAVTNAQTTAILVQAIGSDPTSPSGAIVAVCHNAAASNTNGQLVKESDPPVVIGCVPGDSISVLGLDSNGGNLYVCELTH